MIKKGLRISKCKCMGVCSVTVSVLVCPDWRKVLEGRAQNSGPYPHSKFQNNCHQELGGPSGLV